MAVPWILDSLMLERSPSGSRLDAALQRAGTAYAVGSWHPRTGLQFPPELNADQPQSQHTAPFVAWGSHQFCKALQTRAPGMGLYFGSTDRTTYTTYTAALTGVQFLNPDAVLSSWQQLTSRKALWQRLFPGRGVFTRPNSGFKTYAGQVLRYHNWEEDCAAVDQVSSVMTETLCVVAPTVEITGEFRFVVVKGKVVAGSEYRWDNKLDLRRDWPPECEAAARSVAEHSWQLDTAYVVDVALTSAGARVVELNSWCHAGMYACDPHAVVAAVGALAEEEAEEFTPPLAYEYHAGTRLHPTENTDG